MTEICPGSKETDPSVAGSGSALQTKVSSKRAAILVKRIIPLLLAAGCSSDVAAPEQGTGATGSGGSATGPVEMASCPTQPVPRTPLRRLTRFEYQNAAADLLHVDVSAAQALPADEITSSFDNRSGPYMS